MSRGLSANNLAAVNASHLHEVILVKLDFDTPVYAHSGIGTISFGGDAYLGVGDFGGVTDSKESELLSPLSLTLQLSGVDAAYIAEALDSGNYGDVVTLYMGYRQDDGTLVADPWVIWRGTYEFADIAIGEANVVSITLQHDLAVLKEANGSKFSDEDQQGKYAGDLGFEFIADAVSARLLWGGGAVDIGQPFVPPPWKRNE